MSNPTNTFGTTGTNDLNSTSHTGTGTHGTHIGSTGTHDPITGAAREVASAATNATHPTHHVHSDNEPLPGARGGASTVDYSADHMAKAGAQDLNTVNASAPHHQGAHAGLGAPGGLAATAHDATHGSNTHNQTHGTHNPAHGTHTHDQTLGTHSQTHPHDPTHATHAHDQTHGTHSQTHPHDQHAGAHAAAHQVEGKKPGIGDKIIGKTEQIAGKVTGQHALAEKGAIRATEGKQ